MKIEKTSTAQINPENKVEQKSENKDDLILAHLKRSEELSEEILKAVKFIRRFYFWRGIINGAKIAIIILVIILGIVSWDSISDFFSNFSGNIQETFSSAVREAISERFNSN